MSIKPNKLTMFTLSVLIPDLFTTGLSNHQIIVKRSSGLNPKKLTIANGKVTLEYKTGIGSTTKDQWDTAIPVDSLIEDLVLGIVVLVDGAVLPNPANVTNSPATVTLRKSGGGGYLRATKASTKGSLVGSFHASKSNLILIRYGR